MDAIQSNTPAAASASVGQRPMELRRIQASKLTAVAALLSRINVDSLARHAIHVEKEFEPDLGVAVEKHKVLPPQPTGADHEQKFQ